MNKIHRFESDILKIEDLTPTVKNICISKPSDFKFSAGQFITLIFNIDGKDMRRAYSIASDPSLGHIELCIKKVEGGLACNFLHNMKKGDKIKTIGPAGRFILEGIEGEDIVFISTGTGIAPFRSMIFELLNLNYQGRIYLLNGFRYENEILYKKELAELSEKHSNFINYTIISRPSESYIGEIGRVQNLIQNHIAENFEGRFFLCGLSEMVNDVKLFLLSKGIPQTKIHCERYD